jgi:hypothetical protein
MPTLSIQRLSICCALLCGAIWWSTDFAVADETKPSKKPQRKPASADKQPAAEFNKKHERAALDFVEKHHVELSELLIHLKSAEPKKYQQAVQDLYRTSERLAGFEKRDFKRFEVELALWKSKSRIQVLTARMTMSKEPGMEDELLALFKQQSQLQLKSLELEQQTVKQRLEKIDSQLAAKRSAIDDEPQKKLKHLLQTIRRTESETAKKTAKPTAKQADKQAAKQSAKKSTSKD